MFSHGKVMSTIPFPEVIKYRYPIVHYPQMTNLQRDTDYDRRQLIARVSQGSYNLNAQNYLVGLLKHLSIDPEWTLDYLIAHVRLHSHTLCSLFNITYLSNAGLSTNNVFYYHNATNCLKCISPCLHCTGLYVCTDCIASYFLDNSTNSCYPCHATCRYCMNGGALGCISCIDGYYLNNSISLCQKLTCAYNQYVNSLYGCYSCQDTYPNSM